MPPTVVITDHAFPDVRHERAAAEAAGARLVVAQCRTPAEVIEAGRDADALLVQWAPIDAEVARNLTRCKAIVRYGIGVDNVDLEAARRRGIPVCNVPNYCIDEVADHAVALALALGRQLPQLDARLRSGTWKFYPDRPMPAFREMTFGTLGFGRIARAVHERVRPFRFRRVASDPYVSDLTLLESGVQPLALDDLFREADILSLHTPLTPDTRHVADARRLGLMKPTAVLVNTSRGALVDTRALADALRSGALAGAGLDVFETEPLPDDHPLRTSPNTILTSHVSWYSEASGPRLQQLAAEEAVRALNGEPLQHVVNP